MGDFVPTVVQFWFLAKPAKPALRGVGGTSYLLNRELHFQSEQMHKPARVLFFQIARKLHSQYLQYTNLTVLIPHSVIEENLLLM